MSLFDHKKSLSELFRGYVDFHCHILPGVDDGVQTFEDSARILSIYSELGVEKVFLTPHVMEDVPNKPENLKRRFAELKGYLKSEGVNAPQLELAAENMMDSLFLQRLTSGEVLSLPLKGNSLLVETSYYNPPFNLHDILFQVKSNGYFPVLAHPERYMYMDNSDYDSLRNSDIRFQLNLSSLSGFYGELAQKKAENMLKKGYYDYVGTDLHRLSMLESYRKVKLSGTIWNLLSDLVKRSAAEVKDKD